MTDSKNHSHSYDIAEILDYPTYEREGKILLTCSCGDSITEILPKPMGDIQWRIEDDVLIISGTGAMDNYDSEDRLPPWGRDGFTSLVIEEGITNVGSCAFYNCRSLREVSLPSSMTVIENNAFCMCVELRKLELPEGVTSIGRMAFFACRMLASVKIPFGLTTINQLAFMDCRRLTTIDIPESVTFVGDRAFSLCVKLTTVNLYGAGLKKNVFNCCSSLKTINCGKSYIYEDGVLYNAEKTTLIGCFDMNRTSVEIPYGVVVIGEDSFSFCKSLIAVCIPASVTTIEDSAFFECLELEAVEIPDSVTSIGKFAFGGCDRLSFAKIHNAEENVTVGVGAFPEDTSVIYTK